MKTAVDAPAQSDGAAQRAIFLPMMTKSDHHNRSRQTFFAAKQKTTRSAHHRTGSADRMVRLKPTLAHRNQDCL
jgi:hypothetical protein